MPKLLTWAERMARKEAAEAAKEAKLLPPEELAARRAEIYDTPAKKRIAEKLKTRRTAKTLAEGRKKMEPKENKAGKQICVRLAYDVEEFALTHKPLAPYINELIRRDMLAQKESTNEDITKD